MNMQKKWDKGARKKKQGARQITKALSLHCPRKVQEIGPEKRYACTCTQMPRGASETQRQMCSKNNFGGLRLQDGPEQKSNLPKINSCLRTLQNEVKSSPPKRPNDFNGRIPNNLHKMRQEPLRRFPEPRRCQKTNHAFPKKHKVLETKKSYFYIRITCF